MGLLRLILALSVITAHLPGLFFIRGTVGDVSVQAFYMISGFYIAMILNGKYALNTEFWRNRLLRLFPTYLVVLFFSVMVKIITTQGINAWLLPAFGMSFKNQIFLVLSNLTMIGQDWLFFTGATSSLLPFIVVPQAWSLGLELSFYAIAPFLLRPFRPKLIVGLVLGTVIARVSLTSLGLMNDPWSYRFFPFEIGTFLIGSMAWSFYDRLQLQIDQLPEIAATVLSMVTLAFALSYFALPMEPITKRLLFLLILFLSLPFMFSLSKHMKIDKVIGDLSYPIYLCHFIVIDLLVYIWDIKTMSQWQMTITICASVALASLILRFIERPCERFRQSLKRTTLPTSSDHELKFGVPVVGPFPA
jgi:peptidoglycan/LPS O-acetylase OafA/YrhL